MNLNKVPFVPNDEPLLGILDKFQEGRSHMAIVSRFSAAKAKSVKKAVKQGLTQRIRQTIGISDDSGPSSEGEDSDEAGSAGTRATKLKLRTNTSWTLRWIQIMRCEGHLLWRMTKTGITATVRLLSPGLQSIDPDPVGRRKGNGGKKWCKKAKQGDIEIGKVSQDTEKGKSGEFRLSSKEQITPADAVLAEESANEVCFFSSIIVSMKS